MRNRNHLTLLSTIAISLVIGFQVKVFSAEEQPSLYYDVNILIAYEGDSFRLADLQNDRYLIFVNGKKKTLPQTSIIQVQGSLKFSARYITIEESEYTVENRYYQRLSNEYNQLQSLQMPSSKLGIDNTDFQFDYEDRLMELDMEMADALAFPDTVRVNLTFTPNWTLQNSYLFGLAHFSIQGKNGISKGIKGRMIELDELIPGDTQSVNFDIRGMPEGFELSKVSYHFYSVGEEIPNNLSEKRRLLDEDETYQFFILQYMAANEGKTRGPSLYEPLDKASISKYLREEEINEVVLTVLIDEAGNTKDVIIKSGLTEFQKEIYELARQVQFFPTLKNGEPVEHKINIRLSQIIL